MSPNFSNTKNGVQFALKNGLSFDEAIEVLDKDIERLKNELRK